MNERFIWATHDAQTCYFLADIFRFISDKNKELGHSVKAKTRLETATHWELNAEACRQEAELMKNSEE